MGRCSKCKKDIETFACDSCGGLLCKACGDLTSSEIKCLQLIGKRKLIFYCNECEAGLKQVPVLVAKITEMQAQLADLIANGQQCSPQYTKDFDEIVFEEISDRLSRRRNVVLFGVKDSDNKDTDRRTVSQILDVVVPGVAVETAQMFRLGRYNKDKESPRPIKLILKSEHQAEDILTGSRLLRDSSEFGRVFISPDRTRKQMLFYKNVRKEFDERRKNGENDITIKHLNGMPKIVKKKN